MFRVLGLLDPRLFDALPSDCTAPEMSQLTSLQLLDAVIWFLGRIERRVVPSHRLESTSCENSPPDLDSYTKRVRSRGMGKPGLDGLGVHF